MSKTTEPQPSYWITINHYATAEVIREEIHLSMEEVLEEAKAALLAGWNVTLGID